MNKAALKKFATSARKELLQKVTAKALQLGISENKIKKAEVESSDAIFIAGRQLSQAEKTQRNKLIDRIQQIGFHRVMEEVAYTWFNRFTALRYMEVNDYLPTKVRVLSSTNADSAEPDMMKEALSLDLDLDRERVYEMKVNNETDQLFKYLIIKHCNDFNRYMPFMFETIDDYTGILFPEGLLATDSFVRQMTDTEVIPEDNWKKVEIIGWLYQFYIAEEKDRVFKAKKKYKAEEIPYATQLFTPDWIVRYMVQNSLGRYWIESHPEHRDLLENWEFYLENPSTESDLEDKLAPYINKELRVEDIKCFDPAMGSGHILVYMFDVLYEIYGKCGYMEREIPRLIIENNLYGLDIDDRAYQLACFSVVMKALDYNKRFLRSIAREGLTLHLASIQETNILTNANITYIAGADSGESYERIKAFVDQFHDAKTTGSLIKVNTFPQELLQERWEIIKANPVTDLFMTETREKSLSLLSQLIKQAHIMGNKYDVLVTNPPYMGSRYMNAALSKFLSKHYPDSKGDLFACFMELYHYLKESSFYASINQHSWMFLSSFEKLRKKIINSKTLENMLHLGPRAFEEIGGEVVQSTAFVLRNTHIPSLEGLYVRLTDERTAIEKKEKALEVVQTPTTSNCYLFEQDNFKKIPGSPIAYWVSMNLINIFVNSKKISDFGKACKGIDTGNNDRFLKLWFEIDIGEIGIRFDKYADAIQSNLKYYPYNKGGSFRKWYGNNEYVLYWEENGKDIKAYPNANLRNKDFYRKDGLTWSTVTSGHFSIREFGHGYYFDNGGSCLFIKNKRYFMALLNSKVFFAIQKLSPTLNFQPGDIGRVPVIIDQKRSGNILELVESNVKNAKSDWDSFETSWDFTQHPLLKHKENTRKIDISYKHWERHAENQFNQLKYNEEELNRIFIEIYGLQDEMTPEVEDKDITIRKADLERDIKSFISYAIGCSFGRYSLDEEGLIYAGGEFDPSRYKTFPADKDNILPILPGAYFDDDIVSRFVKFVQVTFGEETLEENLNFIADTLQRRKNETAREAIRRYFLNNFFKDHVQTYKKRPIYWLFTSGKEKAFNCLIYMHRYDKTTLSRIRTDYLHEYQNRLDAEKTDLMSIIESNASRREISNAKKELQSLERKIAELKAYDERLHHMADMQIEIDLDDGVRVNHAKFKGLVTPIR